MTGIPLKNIWQFHITVIILSFFFPRKKDTFTAQLDYQKIGSSYTANEVYYAAQKKQTN